jgi:hypothetical protein
VSNPPIDGESRPSAGSPEGMAPEVTPQAAATEPTTVPAPQAGVGAAPVAEAPPSWPVSTAPYGYPPAVPVAAPERGRASLVILSVLSTLLLVALGVLTVLFVNDRNTISQQRALMDSSAADLRAKSAELTRTQQDLEAAKKDAEADKACAESVRAYSQAMQTAIQSIKPTDTDVDLSPFFQAITGAGQTMLQKCGIATG